MKSFFKKQAQVEYHFHVLAQLLRAQQTSIDSRTGSRISAEVLTRMTRESRGASRESSQLFSFPTRFHFHYYSTMYLLQYFHYYIQYCVFLGETLEGEIGNYLYSGECTYYSLYILQQWHCVQWHWTKVLRFLCVSSQASRTRQLISGKVTNPLHTARTGSDNWFCNWYWVFGV